MRIILTLELEVDLVDGEDLAEFIVTDDEAEEGEEPEEITPESFFDPKRFGGIVAEFLALDTTAEELWVGTDLPFKITNAKSIECRSKEEEYE